MDKILVSTISAHDQSLRYLWFTDDTEVGRSRNSPNPGLKREEALRCDEENGPEVRRLQLLIPFLCPFCGLLCEGLKPGQSNGFRKSLSEEVTLQLK